MATNSAWGYTSAELTDPPSGQVSPSAWGYYPVTLTNPPSGSSGPSAWGYKQITLVVAHFPVLVKVSGQLRHAPFLSKHGADLRSD